MTASGAASPPIPEFDVAVSFAGQDRELVEAIVDLLKPSGIKVFYDRDYMPEMWGEDLVEYFDSIYRVNSRYAVMFVSSHYAEKMWPRHERRSALARGLAQSEPYVLPVRLDDTVLEGLRPTVGFLDARQVGIEGIAHAVRSKLGMGSPAVLSAITRVPRTETERQAVLLLRPPGWEYLYLAGELLHDLQPCEPKYRDHKLRISSVAGDRVPREAVSERLQRATDDAQRLIAALMKLMTPEVQARAFGAPGEPGDAGLIRHLANRWTTIYEGMLDWAAQLRGLSTPSDYHQLFELLARFVDDAVETYRGFVDRLVDQVDRIPQAIANEEVLTIELDLTIVIPDETAKAVHAEIDRLHQAGLLG